MTFTRTKHIPDVCYEIFVRSFCDSNGDKIGDLPGITSKLDYLQELGIEAIWLTPIHPSPSYHKYDVVDFFQIDPEFGTLDDFRILVDEAHQRGIEIYIDLIVNHVSTLHPWFQEARKGPDNPYRNFFWWMTPEEIHELGIGERETSADSDEVYPWHDNPGDPELYYGLFWEGMPDLNYESEALWLELAKIIRFWLIDMKVDGFRLDAARHIYPTWAEDKNQSFWKRFNELARSIKPDVYTVGEIWAHDFEVAPYFQNLNAAFHFDLSFALQRILVMEEDEDLISNLIGSYDLFSAFNPEFIAATMLTNHDQSRIGSILNNSLEKKKLAASILLTLPGQPYIYYGEEIGMLGTKPDPCIREPFLWSSKGKDPDYASWTMSKFSTPARIRPLSKQKEDPESLFEHYKSLIKLRKHTPSLSQIVMPNLQKVEIDELGVLAYIRQHTEDSVLVIHNLTGQNITCPIPEYLRHFSTRVIPTKAVEKPIKDSVELLPYTTVILRSSS